MYIFGKYTCFQAVNKQFRTVKPTRVISLVERLIRLYVLQVSIPALMTSQGGAFQPDKLCRTVDEAKIYAAEYTLLQLGVPIESVY